MRMPIRTLHLTNASLTMSSKSLCAGPKNGSMPAAAAAVVMAGVDKSSICAAPTTSGVSQPMMIRFFLLLSLSSSPSFCLCGSHTLFLYPSIYLSPSPSLSLAAFLLPSQSLSPSEEYTNAHLLHLLLLHRLSRLYALRHPPSAHVHTPSGVLPSASDHSFARVC